MYIPRIIETSLKKYCQAFPVIGLTGPRQSGKSTLIREQFSAYSYVNFDDFKVREYIETDPEGFMVEYNDKVIFDEAQKVPELFNLIKIAIDNDRSNYGKFIITGSSQFAFMKNVSESLAGRIGLLSLLPFQCLEVPQQMRDSSIYQGAYPELVLRDYQYNQEWYAAYLDTYLNKDLREIKDIGNLRDFQRFLRLLASNASQTLNMSHYANDLGISVPTVRSWLSVLEASYIIFTLPPYHKNYGKRITKSPKVYFYDTGLLGYLCSVKTREEYLYGPMLGAIFENYIVSEIKKRELHTDTRAQLYYYRSQSGMEVDVIIDRDHGRELIEIKHGASFKPKMMKAIESIKEKNDQTYILYNGQSYRYKEDSNALNYREYFLS